MRRAAIIGLTLLACLVGSGGLSGTGEASPSPSPGLTKTCHVWPWQLRCQRKLKWPGPETPGKLPVKPPSCRDESTYPTVRDRVKCVWYQQGLGAEWGIADCVAYRESRYVPWASNGSHYGIYQESSVYWGWLWAYYGGTWDDEITNALAATYIVIHHGWSPWYSTVGACW